MQATRGFAKSVRSCGRLVGCFVALVALVAAFVAPSAASAKPAPPITEQYLALGDSLAFGYSQQLYNEGTAAGYNDPEGFENGYANAFLKKIKAKAMKGGKNIKLVNDGCPGETSSGAIGTSESLLATLNAALKESQEKNGLPTVKGSSPCAYQKAWNALKTAGKGGPLHHPYSGSQLEDALEVIRYAQNVEKKPVTTISLNIGANDELAVVAVVEKEAKEFVEAKVKKVGKEAVEAKLKKVAEEAIGAKLKKVAEEAIAAKVNEAVYIKCSEKAFEETGGEEPAFEEARNKCLETEGKKLGEEYYAENAAKLKKEGEEAAGKYFAENKATLEKEGKEAAEKYFGENKAKVEKEGEEAAFKYLLEHYFELNAEGELKGAELVGAALPGLVKQIISNVNGILVAIRSGGSLGLDGGKAVNYPGRIIIQGGYNPYGKQFVFAFEGVEFFLANGGVFGPIGPEGPYKVDNGRCDFHGLTAKEEKEKIEAGCNASELQPGFSSLVKGINASENSAWKAGFGACMSFPVSRFNPGSQTVEPERMKAWVNMTNATQTKIGETLVYNGPDIHPTPAGYSELGAEMLKVQSTTCKKEGLPGF